MAPYTKDSSAMSTTSRLGICEYSRITFRWWSGLTTISLTTSWFGMERTWWYYHIKCRRTCTLALVTSTTPWIVYWRNTRSKLYSPLTQLHH